MRCNVFGIVLCAFLYDHARGCSWIALTAGLYFKLGLTQRGASCSSLNGFQQGFGI